MDREKRRVVSVMRCVDHVDPDTVETTGPDRPRRSVTLRDLPSGRHLAQGYGTMSEGLREAITAALNELGEPGDGYRVPVANAVDILRAALAETEPKPLVNSTRHGFTCGLCSWGRDRERTWDEWQRHLRAKHDR